MVSMNFNDIDSSNVFLFYLARTCLLTGCVLVMYDPSAMIALCVEGLCVARMLCYFYANFIRYPSKNLRL